MSPYDDCSIRHIIQVHFLGFTISRYLDLLFVSLGFDVGFFFFLRENSADTRWFVLGYDPFLCFEPLADRRIQ
jgi:hypothetical protein